MAKSKRAKIIDIVDAWEPKIRDAFLAAIDDITSSADLKRVVTSLQAGDINSALQAVHIDAAAFRPLDTALTQAYEGGGNHAAQQLSLLKDPEDNRLVIRFNARNVRAERYLSSHSSTLITDIVADQQLSVRTALEAGMRAGTNPRQVALDIVGRIDSKTGQRVGGLIGLTSKQEGIVQNFRSALSGDASDLRKALQYKLRDKRLDARILKAIENDEGLDPDLVNTLTTRYRSTLLKLRGDAIGRTEAGQSVQVGQQEAFQQAIDAGQIKAENVSKVWSSVGDSRVRETHRILDGQRVKMDESFISPSGARLRFPHDPTAPAEEVINCRCTCNYIVNHFAGVN